MRVNRLILIALLIAAMLAPGATAAHAARDAVVTNGDLERLGPNGFPLSWGQVGEEVSITSDAHSGHVAFRLVRKRDTAALETGVNRDWLADSGRRGSMLSRLKGGIVFWYKAISQARPDTLTVQIIPMSARPWEDTGSARVIFYIADTHVGDGAWHRAVVKYDFSDNPKVKWVHISPRLLGPGELLLDDFSWVAKVGPLLRVRRIAFTESAESPGREGTLAVEIANRGDEPTPADALTVQAPPGLEVAPAAYQVPALKPDEMITAKLTVRGARYQESALRLTLPGADFSASFLLQAGAALDRIAVDRFILAPGETTKLRATILNTGHTIIKGYDLAARGENITVSEPLRQQLPEVAPGCKTTVEWTIAPIVEGRRTQAEVTAALPGGPVTQRASLMCTAAVPAVEPVTLTDGVRTIAIYKTRQGYGLCDLRVKGDAGDVVLARMPYLGRLVYRRPWGPRRERPLYADTIERTPHSVILSSAFADADGAKWRFTAVFRVSARHRFGLRYFLESDQPREILAFDGPMLYVGEGTDATRLDALFPGLEWLVKGEDSSSDLDLERDHPDRIRYVPHPNKVTIPLMSMRTDAGLVALLWNPHQKWDGRRDRPSAVFASPDRFEHRASHLMGLMLPSVPDFVRENEREARRPYHLQPGTAITLSATLLAEPNAPDALVAQDAWVEEFRIPEPMPYPRGALDKEIAFSATAYLDSLWLPDKKMWRPSKGGPSIWDIPSRNPAWAYDLKLASVLAADAETRRACRERLDLLAADDPLIPVADDLGFDYGRADRGIAWLLVMATQRMDTQGADGAWRFDANLHDQGVFKGMDYHELGRDQAAEVGTCARAAYEILYAARMTGDANAYEAGVRALRFIAQFTVPRAAQVWEVPVHTPDILAAADAVDAYLEAYRIDGDSHWLAEAVKWTRAGLPFVYLWNVPEYPFMRYASIPVFGASWLKWSWIGRAVQWNGLRYGYALLKLSQYDATLPWKKIAQGLTVSAMYQQATEPPDVALWPDSISLIDASKSGWIFAPQQILKNVYWLLGRPQEPETVILKAGDRAVHIDSGARISDAILSNGELDFTLTYPEKKSGTTVIVGVSAPQSVVVDGAALPEVADVLAAPGACYHYASSMALLSVRLTEDGAHRVKIAGVSLQAADFLPDPRSAIAFEFDSGAEGWFPANDLTVFQVANGLLTTQALGGDPYMTRNRMRVDGNAVRAIAVRMAVTGGTGAQFYWGTEDTPGFDETRVIQFEVKPDGVLHEYRLDVGDHPQWKGQTITAIRLDPTNGAPGAKISVDWIRGE